MAKASNNPYPSVLVVEGAAPGAPSAGQQRVFIDSADHKVKRQDSTGSVTIVEGGLANPMTTQDDLIIGGSAGAATRLGKGSDGQVLTVDPTTHHLLWANASSGFANPMTTAGDLILGGTGGAAGRLAKGSDSQVLTIDPTSHLPQWSAAASGGFPWSPAFVAPVAAASWTLLGTGAASDVMGGVKLAVPSSAGNSASLLVLARPSTPPWSVILAISCVLPAAQYAYWGIVARESSTGKFVSFGPQSNSGMNMARGDYTSTLTTPATGFVNSTINANVAPFPLYLKVLDDNTNLTFSYSMDGVTWLGATSMARLSYLTGGADQYGFFGDPYQSSTALNPICAGVKTGTT